MIVCFYAGKTVPIFFTQEELMYILPEFPDKKSLYIQIVGTWEKGIRVFGATFEEYINRSRQSGHYKLLEKKMDTAIAQVTPSWNVLGLSMDYFIVPSRGVLKSSLERLEKGNPYLQIEPIANITPFSWSPHPLKSAHTDDEEDNETPTDTPATPETTEDQVADLFTRREEPVPEELQSAPPLNPQPKHIHPVFEPVDRSGPIRREADRLKSPEEVRYYISELNRILTTTNLIVSFDPKARSLHLEERIVEYEEF